jgi:hypothetical protein
MQNIVRFLERNELELRLSFYLIIINIGWIYLMIIFFSQSNFYNAYNYSLWIPSVIFIIYLIIKKINSGEFLLFAPVRLMFFYFLFQSLVLNMVTTSRSFILNRQKYNELGTFIIETYDEDNNKETTTFIEKIYKKLFK